MGKRRYLPESRAFIDLHARCRLVFALSKQKSSIGCQVSSVVAGLARCPSEARRRHPRARVIRCETLERPVRLVAQVRLGDANHL